MLFRSGVQFPKAFVIFILALGVILLMISVYVFPILARFDNTIKNTLKNAFLMAVLNLPRTILMIVILLLPAVILYFSAYAGIFVMMFGISLPAYLSAFLYSKIFRKFEPEAEAVVSDYEFSIDTDERNEEENG